MACLALLGRRRLGCCGRVNVLFGERPSHEGMNMLRGFVFVLATLLVASGWAAEKGKSPVKVFVLAGQSNMEGHGIIAADPKRNGGKGSLEYLSLIHI